MGAGKGGEVMKIIGAIFLLIVFVSPIYAQDLFDRAEIEFDIDYIDIAGIEIFGNKKSGQVMAVWLKNGDVLTKTLSMSNGKNSYSNDGWQPLHHLSGSDDENLHEVYNYEEGESAPYLNLYDKSTDELIKMARDIINKPEWTYNYKWSNSYSEEIDLCHILDNLKDRNARGSEEVQLTMDVISADLEHGQIREKLYTEKNMLLGFAKGDEELTKQANEFLEENGFNKENY